VDCRRGHQADTEAKDQPADRAPDQVLAEWEGLEIGMDSEEPDQCGRAAAKAQHQAQPGQETAKDGMPPTTHDFTVIHNVGS
jgi:hypothetical protein